MSFLKWLVENATVRLYRIENPDRKPKPPGHWLWNNPTYAASVNSWGRWFTDDPKTLEYYLQDIPNAHVVYVDVPAAEAEQYRVSNMKTKPGQGALDNPVAYSLDPHTEFYLPKEIAMRKQPLER